MTCELCGGALRRRNTLGVCQRSKTCAAEYRKRRGEANPGRAVARSLRYQRNHPERRAVIAARSRAKERGIPFALEYDDLPPVPAVCPIFGIPLVRGEGQPRPGSPELDRIIPELGYVPGNVQWISRRANTMKQDASPEELLAFADWIRRTFATPQMEETQ
jgi:hypothetical protein